MNGLQLAESAVARWRGIHGAKSLDQQCQRFTGYYESWTALGSERGIVTYASAIAAARASSRHDVGGDINLAPVGAYVYWEIGAYGHVARVIGVDLSSGRKLVSMTGKRGTVVRQLTNDVRVVYADSYGARYLGWSRTNGANLAIEISTWNIGAVPASAGFVRSSSISGAPMWPTGALMLRIQQALKNRGRYSGKVDGIGGELTAKAIQTTLRMGAGYTGKVDGKLGPVAARLIQEYAKRWGDYLGPIDSDPLTNSWTAFAVGLETD